MIRIARDYNVASLLRRSFREMLDARYERTRSIDYFGGAVFEFALNLRRHPVRTNHGNRVVICFFRRVDG
jgi:hypothetical protein